MKTSIAIIVMALLLLGCDNRRHFEHRPETRLKCGEICVDVGGAFQNALYGRDLGVTAGKLAHCRCDIPVGKGE